MSALFKLASRGSVVAALAFLALAPACSDDEGDDDSSDAGSSGSGGKAGAGGSSGGKAGSAGSAGKGGSAGSAGSTAGRGGSAGTGGTAGTGTEGGAAGTPDSAGGTGGAVDAGGSGGETVGGAGGGGAGVTGEAGGGGQGPQEFAVAKFCNTLTFGDAVTTMILEIGEGSSKVTFTADTDECVPADGLACTAIPAGLDVPIALFDADDPTTALDEAVADVEADGSYVFNSDVEDSQPVWVGSILDDAQACQDFTFDDL